MDLSRDRLRKLGLIAALAVAITVIISPSLRLVLPRYEEGDIIPENIILAENVNLINENATKDARSRALSEFPPIYDYDPLLKQKTIESLRETSQTMRDDQAAIRKNQSEALDKIRRNSLGKVEIVTSINENRIRRDILAREKRILIDEISILSDLSKPNPKQAFRLEKLRFDLRVHKPQEVNNKQIRDQLNAKLKELTRLEKTLRENELRIRKGEKQGVAQLQKKFEDLLGISLDDPSFRILNEAQFNKELEQRVISFLLNVFDDKIVAALEGFDASQPAIQIQTLDSEELERFESLQSVGDVQQVRDRIGKIASELKETGDPTPYREAAAILAQRLIRPNLTENKGKTERLKQDLLKNLSPLYFTLKKGDVVARARDVATAQQVEIIRALNAYNLSNPKYPQIIGTFLIVLLALGISYRLIVHRSNDSVRSFSRLLLMSLLLLATLMFAQLILVMVPPLTMVYDFIEPRTYNYLIPAALTSMLAGILLPFEIAIFLGFVVSICLAIMMGNSLPFFIYSVMGSFVASIPLQNYQSRFSLWQQGLRISGMNLVVLGVLALLEQRPVNWNFSTDLMAAGLNGLGVAFLTATLLPLIEKLFDITTNLRLLELANMNHPALKELSVRAPGTYHHSIVVGNLSESAAEGITANPLLVRVASYYHDLGKMLCPLYFVENQSKKNYHDDLPPLTSAKIIINHVKDGLEIASRHKLGKTIMDIIGQHHGKSLVRYFFHKAQEEQDDLGEPVVEKDFRYPGPKPQSKEAGLVMVADVTEAATRSVNDPSPGSIRQMVQKLATRIYMEGQLDESGMTFNDLNYVEKVFTKMLISIHHHRIAYPDVKTVPPPKEEEEEQDAETPPAGDILGGRRASS